MSFQYYRTGPLYHVLLLFVDHNARKTNTMRNHRGIINYKQMAFCKQIFAALLFEKTFWDVKHGDFINVMSGLFFIMTRGYTRKDVLTQIVGMKKRNFEYFIFYFEKLFGEVKHSNAWGISF